MIAIAGAALVLLVVAACILTKYRAQRWLLDSEKRSDYFVEQMIEAVRVGNADKMYPLYTRTVPKAQVEQDYQNLLRAWGERGNITYEKTGISIKKTTENGMRLKKITCAYAIDMGQGKKTGLNTLRIERADGKSGLVSVMLLPDAPVQPSGYFETVSQWNIIQWGLFLMSLAVFVATAFTAVVCYSKCRRFKWLWIGLILLLYVSPRCIYVSSIKMISMGADLSLAGLSSLIIYPAQTAVLRIRIPLGMMLYWGLHKRLSSNS